MTQMYIFVDSERPDAYLNALVHGIMHRDVRGVCFVHIKGLGGAAVHHGVEGYSARIMTGVQSLLESLSERAEYRFQNGDVVQISSKSKSWSVDRIRDYYSRARQQLVNYSNKDIEYTHLKQLMKSIAKGANASICDVSGIRKTYLGDLVATGLGEGLLGLYTFEIIDRINYEEPWRMLIHMLNNSKPLYNYVNILDTPLYKDYSRLMIVISTWRKLAIIVLVALLTTAVVLTFVFGPDSEVAKNLNLVSQIASVISLLMALFPVLRTY